MPTWPSSLPEFERDTYSFTPAENLIESQTEVGPPMVRRRTTANVASVTASILCDQTQFATFRTFFTTTLAGGVFSFTRALPHDPTTTVTLRFKAKGAWSPSVTSAYVRVQMQLWVLP